MLTVVASYRQNVHAYPSGGGDYEVATVNLGQNAGVTVASALLVDYVLTVAVSISSGVDNAGCRAAVRQRARGGSTPASSWLLLAALNLRGVRESGSWFAIPTYGFMVAIFGMALWGCVREAVRRPARGGVGRPRRPARRPGYEGADHDAGAGLPAGAGLLVRLRRADRRRGDLQRRAGVPQAEEPQRRDDAAAAGRASRSR